MSVLGLALWAAVATAGATDVGAELLSSGRLEEAKAVFAAELERDPSSTAALLGLARAHRWSGEPLRALTFAERALASAPERADLEAELAESYLAAGLPGRAREVAPDFAAARAANRATLTLVDAFSQDSQGLTRHAPRLVAEAPLGRDLRGRLALGLTDVSAPDGAVHRSVGGGSLSYTPLPQWGLRGALSVYRDESRTLLGGAVGLTARPADGLQLQLTGRRVPFIDPVELVISDEGAFHGAGVSGTQRIGAAGRGLDELVGNISTSALPQTYLYLQPRLFRVTDGNGGYSFAGGFGTDLARTFGAPGWASVTARWDSFVLGFDQRSPDYYSASLTDGHGPGLTVSLAFAERARLMAEGGLVVAALTAADPGAYVGGAFELRIGDVVLAARAQHREDPWFRNLRIFGTLSGPLPFD